MNIYEKIQQVANEVRSLAKDMTVGSGNYGYKAVSDTSVTLAVKKAEKNAGIVSIPIKQDLVSNEILKTLDGSKEKITYHAIIKMTTRIVNLEQPSEFVDIESFGQGLDSGDKGLGKASTYARKYALLNAYKIATGEDPDALKSNETYSAKTISEKRTILTNFLLSNNAHLQNVLSNFNLGSIDDLSEKEVNTTYAAYQKKGILQ